MWLIKQISVRLFLVANLFISPMVMAKTAPILSSIKPIQLIVNEISGERSGILVSGAASVHSYTLKPSDLKKMNQARVLFWIGPTMESFLAKVIKRFPDLNVVTLIDLEALNLHEGHGHNHGHHEGDVHDDEPHAYTELTLDTHIWLSPSNALVIAEQVEKKLSALWPNNAALYQKNLLTFTKKLEAQIVLSKSALLPIKNNGFVGYHDAWEYWVNFFELKQLDTVVTTPEHKPSAKKLYKIRRYFKKRQSHCMLLELGINQRQIAPLVKELNVNVVMADPLALNSNSYIDWVAQTTERFVHCLSD